MKKFLYGAFLFCFALGLLFFDFYSKAYVYHLLPLSEASGYMIPDIAVFRDFYGVDFSITLALNKGAAWGAFADFQHPILVFRILVILGMLCYLLFFLRDRTKEIPFLLIITGALGNVIDYFLYGSVVDFLRFNLWGYPFPIFNVADSLITCGVASFFIISLFRRKTETCLEKQPLLPR